MTCRDIQAATTIAQEVGERKIGLTRVMEIGSLRVTNPDPVLHCSIPPTSGPAELLTGEVVEYLYYVGEGRGRSPYNAIHMHANNEAVEIYRALGFEVKETSRIAPAGSTEMKLCLD